MYAGFSIIRGFRHPLGVRAPQVRGDACILGQIKYTTDVNFTHYFSILTVSTSKLTRMPLAPSGTRWPLGIQADAHKAPRFSVGGSRTELSGDPSQTGPARPKTQNQGILVAGFEV